MDDKVKKFLKQIQSPQNQLHYEVDDIIPRVSRDDVIHPYIHWGLDLTYRGIG